MINVKSQREIEFMRQAGKISAMALNAAGAAVCPGITTKEIDAIAHKVITDAGATPSFLGYMDYPAAACVSVNDEVIHGIPSNRVIHDGDIVKIDVGAYIFGFNGDCAATFGAGNISREARRLIEVTRQSFYEGLKYATPKYRVYDISNAICRYAEKYGYTVVRSYTGHGVGENLHEDPEVPNFGTPGKGPRLIPGMTIAVEPMINEGASEVFTLPNGWTVKTIDGKFSSHYENTILITENAPELLTVV